MAFRKYGTTDNLGVVSVPKDASKANEPSDAERQAEERCRQAESERDRQDRQVPKTP